jgi:hypothetical protein
MGEVLPGWELIGNSNPYVPAWRALLGMRPCLSGQLPENVRTFAGELDIEHVPGELPASCSSRPGRPRARVPGRLPELSGATRVRPGDLELEHRERARAPGRSAGDESPGTSCRRAAGDIELELPGTSCRSSSTGATSSTQGSCQGL